MRRDRRLQPDPVAAGDQRTENHDDQEQRGHCEPEDVGGALGQRQQQITGNGDPRPSTRTMRTTVSGPPGSAGRRGISAWRIPAGCLRQGVIPGRSVGKGDRDGPAELVQRGLPGAGAPVSAPSWWPSRSSAQEGDPLGSQVLPRWAYAPAAFPRPAPRVRCSEPTRYPGVEGLGLGQPPRRGRPGAAEGGFWPGMFDAAGRPTGRATRTDRLKCCPPGPVGCRSRTVAGAGNGRHRRRRRRMTATGSGFGGGGRQTRAPTSVPAPSVHHRPADPIDPGPIYRGQTKRRGGLIGRRGRAACSGSLLFIPAR